MDFGRGLSYIRRDPDWLVKTLLGSVLQMVPILNFAAIGYSLDVVRNVYAGRELPLPEWGENFGDRWVRGLIGVVIQFIYMLPLLVLGCGWFLAAASGSAAVDSARMEDGSAAAGAVTLCFIPIFFGGALVLSALAVIAQTRYAITNDFRESMRIGAVVAELRAGLGAWIGIIAMAIVVGFAFSIVAMLTCGLGFLLLFYVTLAVSHWMAQAHHRASGDVRTATGGI